MENQIAQTEGSRVTWYTATALALAAAVALFLYADGYFDASAAADAPNEANIIVGK